MRSRAVLIGLVALAAALVVPSAASAHERYASPDDKYTIVLGEQNEPVYTYDWTNLDLIISDNATGGPVAGAEETLTATLIAPNGEELALDLEPQFGSDGSYAFVQDYFLTLPGQYKVQLEGDINGTDVTGEYLLPGPREDMKPRAFPAPVEKDLRELEAENAELRSQIEELESRMNQMDDHMAQMMEGGMGHGSGDSTEANAPGPGLFAALIAVGLVVWLRRRD